MPDLLNLAEKSTPADTDRVAVWPANATTAADLQWRSTQAIRVQGETAYLTDPRWWDPDDVNTSFQAWANAMTAANGAVGVIPPGDYALTQTITWQDIGNGYSLKVDGYGAKITYTGSDACFATRTPADQTDAANTTGLRERWRWNGIWFQGNRSANQIGFLCNAGTRWVLDQCTFQNFDQGFLGRFALLINFRDCFFTGSGTYNVNLESGNWSGATGSNSAGNMPKFDHCRFIAYANMPAQLRIRNIGGAAVRDCTFEGAVPQYDILLDPAGNTSALMNVIENAWCEHTSGPTAAVKVNGNGHKTRISFAHVTHGVWVEATDGSPGLIIVEASGDYGLPAAKWNNTGTGSYWVFGPGVGPAAGGWSTAATANWVDGDVPGNGDMAQYGMQFYAPLQQTVSGSRGGNAALADLIGELGDTHLVFDGTTP